MATVIFPVQVEIDFDYSKVTDDEYIEQKQEEAKDRAANILETSTIKPVIHNSEVFAIIE